MTQYIDKSALVAEIEKIKNTEYNGNSISDDVACCALDMIIETINTLEVKDPYKQCVQYDSIKAGIQAHAETYSFNIQSELFNQLTKEQQALWRKEIEQAVISGGDAGVTLARDQRYKDTLEVKEEVLDSNDKTKLMQKCVHKAYKRGYDMGVLQTTNKMNHNTKDVDLEKEIDEWMKYGPHTNYPWCTIPDAIKITAEHFFELGLKAKGE